MIRRSLVQTKSMIKKEVNAGKGFRDLETYRDHRAIFLNPEARIQYLEEKLAYKEQELEVLKKIVSLGVEGKKQ